MPGAFASFQHLNEDSPPAVVEHAELPETINTPGETIQETGQQHGKTSSILGFFAGKPTIELTLKGKPKIRVPVAGIL